MVKINMKTDPTHQIIDFHESDSPVQISPHKGMQSSSIKATLWHEQIEIKLFYSEGEEIVIGNDLFVTEKNDIYIINSCEPHSTQKTNESTDYHMLIIDTAKLPTIPDSEISNTISAIRTGHIVFKNRIKNSDYLKKLIEELVEDFEENRKNFSMKGLGLVYIILNELVRSEAIRKSSEISRKNIMNYTKQLSPAIEIINNSYNKKIQLTDLSAACGLSEKYFCKVFRLLTGMTSIEYINKLRINKAEVLISTTDKPLSEISEICGFNELSYFSKKFKQIKGYSPTDARKK